MFCVGELKAVLSQNKNEDLFFRNQVFRVMFFCLFQLKNKVKTFFAVKINFFRAIFLVFSASK